LNEELLDIDDVDRRLLDPRIMGVVKERKRLRDWNETALIMILKCHKEQIEPLKQLILSTYPNIFIAFDRREPVGVKFLVVSENDLMLAREELTEQNRKEIEERSLRK
jgi:hypothetical protein